ncbi:TIGR02234 family membrane protein [Streptomyces sp. 3MP-14]|uniref:TIGR02234 family membrane protein n=1 Tax=Streptomyces mimosae TaxID=2586635 RepID=A0A5N6ALY9_9ACTN|nr:MULTISPECIES: TIGR02234 family membrane protein [Streptomyces]KAB8168719.1 TIGR02234 family membrane protein [Streptomyces mimosae]KAB8178001.1 TIGR02234 family membrane protein [Streptomyces sp. 3MP-14]
MTRNPSDSARASRRALGVALLSGAAGAAVVLISAGQTWGEGDAQGGGAELPVTASGSAVSGLPSALALVGLAALVAVFAVRGTGRVVVASVLALSGAGAIGAALLGSGDTEALDRAAAEVMGISDVAVTSVSHTGWPWFSALGGLLLLCAGLLALSYGRQWPAMSSRYERGGREVRGRRGTRRADEDDDPGPDRPEDIWRALDRGEDPT